MATPEEISTLREYINEPTQTTYSDDYLSDLLDASGGDLRKVAATVWSRKAARYAELVDVQEGSSSRKLGDLYEQALDMSKHWASDEDGTVVKQMRPARTRPIERP